MSHTLTDEEIDKLEGRELDAAVAEHVLGWQGLEWREHIPGESLPGAASQEGWGYAVTIAAQDEGWYGQSPAGLAVEAVPSFSTEIELAFVVAQHMAVRLFQRSVFDGDSLEDEELNSLTLIQCSSVVQDGAWFAAFQCLVGWDEDLRPEVVAKMRAAALARTAPLAICRAALKAVRQ